MIGQPLHKEIRKVLDEADDAGFRFTRKSGHTYGWVICSCGQHVQVFSTGKNPENGAKVIRRFITKHRSHNQ